MKASSKEFWKAAIVRAVRTIAQTAVSTIGTSALMSDVNWTLVLSASCLAGIFSILTSIATGLPEVTTEEDKTEPETETEGD